MADLMPSMAVNIPTNAIIPMAIIKAVITARSLLPAILFKEMLNMSVVLIIISPIGYFFL
jgi:hypothetical protein